MLEVASTHRGIEANLKKKKKWRARCLNYVVGLVSVRVLAWRRVPSVPLSFLLLLWGEGRGVGLHGNSEVSDVCLSGAGALGCSSTSRQVFYGKGKKKGGPSLVCEDEVLGQLRLVSAAENFVWASSVYACATCVFVCARVCVCVFLRCSHRGASRNIFSPLWQHFPAERERKKWSFIFT